MHIKAIVEYEGTSYYGFQIQPDKPTIQDEIQKALKKIFNKEIAIKYSSRTDGGVHASGQVISFEISHDIARFKIRRAMNDMLDKKIIIKDIFTCESNFNPRYDAKLKLYVYKILNQETDNYLLKDYVWHIQEKINWKDIKKSLKLIKGQNDFSLFSSENKHKKTQIDIASAVFKKMGNLYEISLKGPYFLNHMVRHIIGFLVAVGKGKENMENLKNMLEGKGKKCSYCAPAKGLELRKIWF